MGRAARETHRPPAQPSMSQASKPTPPVWLYHPTYLLYCGSTGAIAVIKTDLSDVYRAYIACLNKQDWPKLEQFVDDEVVYNGARIGISGYRQMLEKDFSEIPDLYFDIQLLISDPPHIASRLE